LQARPETQEWCYLGKKLTKNHVSGGVAPNAMLQVITILATV
jgi:hypothetical protein